MVDCGRKPLLLSWYFRVFFLNSEMRDGGWSKPGDMWQLLTFSTGCKHQKSSTVRPVPPGQFRQTRFGSLLYFVFKSWSLETGSKGLETSVGLASVHLAWRGAWHVVGTWIRSDWGWGFPWLSSGGDFAFQYGVCGFNPWSGT